MSSHPKEKTPYQWLKLDITDVDGYSETENDRLRDVLETARIDAKQVLYRAITGDAKKMRILRQHGTDLPQYDSVMAFTHDEVFSESEPFELTLWDCIDQEGDNAVIALYLASKFKDSSPFESQKRLSTQSPFFFRDPEKKLEALVAIIDVRI